MCEWRKETKRLAVGDRSCYDRLAKTETGESQQRRYVERSKGGSEGGKESWVQCAKFLIALRTGNVNEPFRGWQRTWSVLIVYTLRIHAIL